MENVRGAALMVAAMAGFAFEDMFVKSAARSLPVGEILMIFGFAGMCVFIALKLRSGRPVLHPAILSRPIAIRAANEVVGRLGYTLGIALTPLSNASAILQATPLVVVAGAAVFFGEKVGWRRWLAIAIGFAGVLVILRPATDGFVPASLWVVLGLLGFAARDLATRAAPPVLSNLQLGVYGFFMLIPTGALILSVTGGAAWPGGRAALDLLGAVVFGTAAYYGVTAAMRMGDVSVVTPFRYTRLLFALVLAAIVFGERPDLPMWIGAGLIVASGLYTLLSGRRRPGRGAAPDPGVFPQ